MKKFRNQAALAELLQQAEPRRRMLAKDRFWAVFRARAGLMRQENKGPATTAATEKHFSRMSWRFSSVMALVLLLFAIYTVFTSRLSDSPTPVVYSPSPGTDEQRQDRIEFRSRAPHAESLDLNGVADGRRRLGREMPLPAEPRLEAAPSAPERSVQVDSMMAMLAEEDLMPAAPALSEIVELEVAIDHQGLMIVHDEKHGGTFILLAWSEGRHFGP